jgi:hypothetical protein
VVDSSVGKKALWAGRIMSALPVALMVVSAGFKLSGALAGNAQMVENWAKSGFPASTLLPIGVVELACVVLYLIPRTSVLGAVLVAGYLGGAVCTHVRSQDGSFVAPLLCGILAWGGLYLRDPRLRALLPLTRDA